MSVRPEHAMFPAPMSEHEMDRQRLSRLSNLAHAAQKYYNHPDRLAYEFKRHSFPVDADDWAEIKHLRDTFLRLWLVLPFSGGIGAVPERSTT